MNDHLGASLNETYDGLKLAALEHQRVATTPFNSSHHHLQSSRPCVCSTSFLPLSSKSHRQHNVMDDPPPKKKVSLTIIGSQMPKPLPPPVLVLLSLRIEKFNRLLKGISILLGLLQQTTMRSFVRQAILLTRQFLPANLLHKNLWTPFPAHMSRLLQFPSW